MDQPNNFTPLNFPQTKKVKPSSSIVMSSFFAFLFALFLTGITYVGLQSTKPKTLNSKASEVIQPCITEITSPRSADAFIMEQDKPKQLALNEKISTSSVILQWQPVPQANAYFVALSDDPKSKKGTVDPAEIGKKTSSISYQFDNLQPQKTYFFLIRSIHNKGTISVIYPTMGNCTYLYGALPLLEINTQ